MRKFLITLSTCLLGVLASSMAHADTILVFETNRGAFEVKLYTQEAPKTCENITRLAEKGYYDGTVFHRVIPNFMIQGGDPTATGTGGESIWGEDFEDEVQNSLVFDRPGLLAMANRGPNTNGSQFFITVAPTPHLNKRHTIFGEVISGYDIVDQISKIKTGASDKPIEDQKIIHLTVKNT